MQNKGPYLTFLTENTKYNPKLSINFSFALKKSTLLMQISQKKMYVFSINLQGKSSHLQGDFHC